MEVVLKYFSDFTPAQLQQFQQLEELYKEWNEKINVISRKDIDSLYEKHVLHSLSIAAVFQFHLTDSIGKKLKVVNEVAAAIGLKNVTTQHTRTEEIQNRKFDFVVSRAVAPLRDLWRWSLPIIKAKGQGQFAIADEEKIYGGLICLKGGDLTEEVKESGPHPIVWEIDKLFSEDFFKQKYILSVRR